MEVDFSTKSKYIQKMGEDFLMRGLELFPWRKKGAKTFSGTEGVAEFYMW